MGGAAGDLATEAGPIIVPLVGPAHWTVQQVAVCCLPHLSLVRRRRPCARLTLSPGPDPHSFTPFTSRKSPLHSPAAVAGAREKSGQVNSSEQLPSARNTD